MKPKQLVWTVDATDVDLVYEARGVNGDYVVHSRAGETKYSAWLYFDNGAEKFIGTASTALDAREWCQAHYEKVVQAFIQEHTEPA